RAVSVLTGVFDDAFGRYTRDLALNRIDCVGVEADDQTVELGFKPRLILVAQAKIQRKLRIQTEIILDECAIVVDVIFNRQRCRHTSRGRKTKQKTGNAGTRPGDRRRSRLTGESLSEREGAGRDRINAGVMVDRKTKTG